MPRYDFARLLELLADPACFAYRRVIVVTARVRLEWPVRAAPHPERSPAVRHVDAERGIVREHVFEIAQVSRALSEMMWKAPRIEPSGIELAAHERTSRLDFAQGFEAGFRVLAEVDDLKEFFDKP